MKTLLFCNLIPAKTGAFESLLVAVGEEFRRHGDEYVVVFAGEPIAPVAESLCAAGVRWHVMSEWVEGQRKGFEQKHAKAAKDPACAEGCGATREIILPASGGANTNSSCASCPSVQINSSAERVRPWAFVLPALRIIRNERPDVVAVHFGNEMPTLVASLLCRVMYFWDRLVWEGTLLRTKLSDYSSPCQHLATSREEGFEQKDAKAAKDPAYAEGYGATREIIHPASGGGKKYPSCSLWSSVQESSTCSRAWRAPRWIWEQDQQIQDPGRISRHLSKIRLLGLGVDRFLAVYEGGRESLQRRGIPRQRISVIPNAVSDYVPQRPAGWLRRSLNIAPNAVLMVSVGSLIERKRHRMQLDALATLVEQGYEVVLVAVGDGPLAESLRAYSRERGVEKFVVWLGHRNDVREILAEADILVHTAEREACCYSILETMCAGKPAVVVDAGAAREQVEHGVTGYVVAPGDTNALAACGAKLITNPKGMKTMGSAARQRWERNYELGLTARSYRELYEGVCVEQE